MCPATDRNVQIRRCIAADYDIVGALIAGSYAALPGMPQPDEQPDYYAMLMDVASRNAHPSISVFVAVNADDEPVGSVDFIRDMRHYGSSGTACTLSNSAGIRLLAVRPDWRGVGVGQALTRFCIEHARRLEKSQVILHTTRFMQTAWSMYERMGFERHSAIDFNQGALEVFGFALRLTRA